MIVSLLPVPALLIRMSAPPNSRSTAAISVVARPRAVATSQATADRLDAVGLGDPRRASLGSRSALRAAMTMSTPSAASPSAIGKADADAAAGDDGDLALKPEIHPAPLRLPTTSPGLYQHV